MELIIAIQQASFTGVTPGTYNVTVQNAAGCISTATPVTILGAPAAPAAPTVNHTDPTTCANPTGTITVTAPLGAGLSYSIDGIDYSKYNRNLHWCSTRNL